MNKVYQIEWLDTITYSTGWEGVSRAEDLAACPCKSFGVIIHEGKDSIVLAQTIQRSKGEFNGCITIPKGCITKRKIIEKLEPLKSTGDKS